MKSSEIIAISTYLISIIGAFITIILVSNIKITRLFKEISSLIVNKKEVLNLSPKKVGNLYFSIKRGLDIIFSLTGIMLFLPLILIISVVIKLTSKGPVFRKIRRIGRNKKIFYEYKFRTIRYEALNKEQIEKIDYTKIGLFLYRTSVDMIPNYINVLLGDMTIVGVSKYSKIFSGEVPDSFREAIDKEKPSIVGLWAISNDKQGFKIDSCIYYDIYYLCNRSLLLEVAMVYRTLLVTFGVIGEYY